jgi:hypothetical protein
MLRVRDVVTIFFVYKVMNITDYCFRNGVVA